MSRFGDPYPDLSLSNDDLRTEVVWKQTWDEARHWSTTVRGYHVRRVDNGEGWFDVDRFGVGGALKYRHRHWEFSGTVRWSVYDYALERASPLDPELRTREDLELEGRIDEDAPVLDNASLAHTLRPIPQAVHAQGGKILLQVLHAGRYAKVPQPVGASEIPSRINPRAPRRLSQAEIEQRFDIERLQLRRVAGFGRTVAENAVIEQRRGQPGQRRAQAVARQGQADHLPDQRHAPAWAGSHRARSRWHDSVVQTAQPLCGVSLTNSAVVPTFRAARRCALRSGIPLVIISARYGRRSLGTSRAVAGAGAVLRHRRGSD